MYMLSLSALSIFPFCCLFTSCFFFFFFFNDTATTEIYTLSLHDALPILDDGAVQSFGVILKHQLPSGVHVVVDAAARAQAHDIEAAEPTREGSERAGEGLRLLRQVDEQEPFPVGDGDLVERVVPLVEPRHL